MASTPPPDRRFLSCKGRKKEGIRLGRGLRGPPGYAACPAHDSGGIHRSASARCAHTNAGCAKEAVCVAAHSERRRHIALLIHSPWPCESTRHPATRWLQRQPLATAAAYLPHLVLSRVPAQQAVPIMLYSCQPHTFATRHPSATTALPTCRILYSARCRPSRRCPFSIASCEGVLPVLSDRLSASSAPPCSGNGVQR